MRVHVSSSLVGALWMYAGPAHAVDLTVFDTLDCVDPIAAQEVLDVVLEEVPVAVSISVVPNGEVLAIELIWLGIGERQIEIPAGDCEQLPAWVGLSTERAVAALPGGLEALFTPPVWSGRVGVGAGSGLPPSPRASVGVWAHQGRTVAALYGLTGQLGGQAVGSGSVTTVSGHLWMGAAVPAGPVRIDLSTGGGVVRGQGRDLDITYLAVLPQWRGRLAVVRTIGISEVGLGVEVPLLRTVWIAEGVARAPEPVVRLALEWHIRLSG